MNMAGLFSTSFQKRLYLSSLYIFVVLTVLFAIFCASVAHRFSAYNDALKSQPEEIIKCSCAPWTLALASLSLYTTKHQYQSSFSSL